MFKFNGIGEKKMTKIYALLGHPIGHSKSPLIHNDAFKASGMDAAYHAFDVEPNRVKEAIDGIRALQIAGCNVTVPHKITVMDYLDEIDDEARLIGAVNTIVNENGRLIGYNTDGRGYVESLIEESGATLANKRFLVIGAGGAARGIVTALVRHGIGHLSITNRTKERAIPLVELAESVGTEAMIVKRSEAEKEVNAYDIIINTTSVGMSPNVDDSPFNISNINEGKIVSDLIYNPLETAFLQAARKRGAKTTNGVGMFVNQAALSFEHWTGKRPDRKRMRRLVEQQDN